MSGPRTQRRVPQTRSTNPGCPESSLDQGAPGSSSVRGRYHTFAVWPRRLQTMAPPPRPSVGLGRLSHETTDWVNARSTSVRQASRGPPIPNRLNHGVHVLSRDVARASASTFNPKVAGSIPARPNRKSPANTLFPSCLRSHVPEQGTTQGATRGRTALVRAGAQGADPDGGNLHSGP